MDGLYPVLTVVVLLGAGWWWYHESLRRERKRLEAFLEWLASGGGPERMTFLSRGSLSSLMVPLERVTGELARLRQQAQEKAFNLQNILESMEEGVMIVDDRHVLRLVNPSFIRLFQLKSDPEGLTILHTLRNTTVEEMVTAALES
ncbi:MAG: PAS domain-containing protein, partial [Verrucomicrobiaceae bacterium]